MLRPSLYTAATLLAAMAGGLAAYQGGATAVVPSAVQAEHQHLVSELAAAVRAGGRTGAAAAELQRLLQPHFKAEEAYALPQLGVLAALATGKPVRGEEQVIQLSTRLKADLEKMLDEHKAIGAATTKLASAAKIEKQAAAAAFAANLKQHAQMEEQVMYPAAILAGEYLKKK